MKKAAWIIIAVLLFVCIQLGLIVFYQDKMIVHNDNNIQTNQVIQSNNTVREDVSVQNNNNNQNNYSQPVAQNVYDGFTINITTHPTHNWVNWNNVANAYSYTIQRRYVNGSYETLKTTSDASYMDYSIREKTEYYYRVIANLNGGGTVTSYEKHIYTEAATSGTKNTATPYVDRSTPTPTPYVNRSTPTPYVNRSTPTPYVNQSTPTPTPKPTFTPTPSPTAVHYHAIFKVLDYTAPNCKNKGYYIYECGCGYRWSEDIPATGNHKWKNYVMFKTCDYCGETVWFN